MRKFGINLCFFSELLFVSSQRQGEGCTEGSWGSTKGGTTRGGGWEQK